MHIFNVRKILHAIRHGEFFAPQELTFLSDFYVIIEHRFLEERIFGNEWQKKIRHQ